jgi:hypothetical protein
LTLWCGFGGSPELGYQVFAATFVFRVHAEEHAHDLLGRRKEKSGLLIGRQIPDWVDPGVAQAALQVAPGQSARIHRSYLPDGDSMIGSLLAFSYSCSFSYSY